VDKFNSTIEDLKYKHGLWAVILKEGHVFIGYCGIIMQNIGDETVPEIGFHIPQY